MNIGIMMIEPVHVVILAVLVFFAVFFLLVIRRLWPVFAYAYPNARLAAMDARLFSGARVREIAGEKSVNDAFEVLSGTDYNKICDADTSDCESIFNQYFIDHVLEVRKFSPKMAMPLFNFYVREWEIYNVKNALRIVMSDGAPGKDDVKHCFVDVSGFGFDKMNEVVSCEDIAGALGKLKDTVYYPVIDEYLKKCHDEENPGLLEAMLDKYNLLRLYEDAEPQPVRGLRRFLTGKKTHDGRAHMNAIDSFVVRNYAGVKADVLNIGVALRILLEKRIPDVESEQFIHAGLFIDSEKREKMRSLNDIENLGKIVSGTPYEEGFRNGLNEFKKTGKIEGILRRLDDLALEHVKAMALNYPFSIAVMVRYMALKRNEVFLLRSIFKGISDNVTFEIDDGMRVVAED